jgi:hypothetical protein
VEFIIIVFLGVLASWRLIMVFPGALASWRLITVFLGGRGVMAVKVQWATNF